MKKKIILLIIGAFIWFLPAYILYTFFDKGASAFWLFVAGWITAVMIMAYLE